MNITEIDSNFKIPDDVQREDLVWHDVRTAPVSLYGLCDPTDATSTFHRFPFDVGERVGGKVKELNLRPAGGRGGAAGVRRHGFSRPCPAGSRRQSRLADGQGRFRLSGRPD